MNRLHFTEETLEVEGESVRSIPSGSRNYVMPTPTEIILRAVEMSDAEEEATRFVRHIQELQGILATTTSIEGFDATKQRLVECYELAKSRFEFYERMADVWRGAEFNLNMFLRNVDTERSAVLERAQQEFQRIEAQRAAQHAAERAAAEERLQTILRSTLPTLPTLPTSISELLLHLTNDAQKQALSRLLARSESNQVYLAGYEANTQYSGRAYELQGTFTIMGTIRHGNRESYTIKWYRLDANKPSFWCNCPDHKFNSGKKNMVCKHICFLVTRVARILDPAFFESREKRLTREQYAVLLEAVGNAAIFQERPHTQAPLPTHTNTSRDARRTIFMECRKPVDAEDSCPICYDTMVDTTCINCPTCSNNVHKECMEVWLERNKSCVYCRSTVWCSY